MEKKNNNVWKIIGIVAGAAAVATVVTVILVKILNKKKKAKAAALAAEEELLLVEDGDEIDGALEVAADEALEDAALVLPDEGSVSEIVETDEGFYIFVRMKDEQNTLEDKLSELLSSYQWAHTERIKETFRASLDFAWEEEIDFLSIT